MMVGGRLVMFSSVVVVVMFGHILPYKLAKCFIHHALLY